MTDIISLSGGAGCSNSSCAKGGKVRWKKTTELWHSDIEHCRAIPQGILTKHDGDAAFHFFLLTCFDLHSRSFYSFFNATLFNKKSLKRVSVNFLHFWSSKTAIFSQFYFLFRLLCLFLRRKMQSGSACMCNTLWHGIFVVYWLQSHAFFFFCNVVVVKREKKIVYKRREKKSWRELTNARLWCSMLCRACNREFKLLLDYRLKRRQLFVPFFHS